MGSSNTKVLTESVIQNYINTNIVNKQVTSHTTTASSAQSVSVDGYAAYELWLKSGGTGNMPTCKVSNINLSSVQTLDTSTQAKSEMANNIVAELKAKAEQLAKNDLDQQFAIVANTDVQTKQKIANNVLTNITNESVTNTITSAAATQEFSVKCGGNTNVEDISISAVSNMISKSLTDMVVKNTSLSKAEGDNKQTADNKTTSIFTRLTNMISDVFKAFSMGWIVMILMVGIVFIVILRSPKAVKQLMDVMNPSPMSKLRKR